MMKLMVKRPGSSKSEPLEGKEAAQELRRFFADAKENMLVPIPDLARKVLRDITEALRAGRPVWNEPTKHGNPSDKSTVLTMPLKIRGIIRADGTWDGEGPDPRHKDEDVAKGSSQLLV